MKKNFKNLKIFVAGHRGMVGTAFINYIKKKKFGKIITVNRNKLNLESEKNVNRFIKNKKPDIIINCAGKVGGILANSTYPTEFLNENILIQMNIIKAAYKNNVKHLFNLGSSCIYPKNAKQPIKVEYLLSNKLEKTNEAYAIAKIVGLKMCDFYNQQYKTSYLTIMPCNLYGPNDNFDSKNSHFIPALIKKFTNSKNKKGNVEIWGTGRPKREVMHVDDLAGAIYFIIKKKISNNKNLLDYLKKTSVINVGSSKEYTIKQLANIINKITNNNSKLIFNKKYPDGTMRKILDNSSIKKLGWKPKIKLNEGLSQTISWYKKKYLKKLA
jgi:GDP-L-fucose synthase